MWLFITVVVSHHCCVGSKLMWLIIAVVVSHHGCDGSKLTWLFVTVVVSDRCCVGSICVSDFVVSFQHNYSTITVLRTGSIAAQDISGRWVSNFGFFVFAAWLLSS